MPSSCVKPINIRAIEKATGTSWEDWHAYLDKMGAADLDHGAIVAKARSHQPISGWWAQSIAVAYEQSIGRRKPGQGADGLFAASVSRTVKAPRQSAFKSWCKFAANLDKVDGQFIDGSPTTTTTPKRLYWRCKFEDESTISMSFEAKGDDKVLIAIEHRKLELEVFMADRKHAWAGLLSDCFSG